MIEFTGEKAAVHLNRLSQGKCTWTFRWGAFLDDTLIWKCLKCGRIEKHKLDTHGHRWLLESMTMLLEIVDTYHNHACLEHIEQAINLLCTVVKACVKVWAQNLDPSIQRAALIELT